MNHQEIIPSPCKEKWSGMSGTDHKRFCEKCDHHVHNITGMEITAIDNLRIKNGGKLCGVIRLTRNIALSAGIASLAACDNTYETIGECVGKSPPPENLTDSIPKADQSKTLPPLNPIIIRESPIPVESQNQEIRPTIIGKIHLPKN